MAAKVLSTLEKRALSRKRVSVLTDLIRARIKKDSSFNGFRDVKLDLAYQKSFPREKAPSGRCVYSARANLGLAPRKPKVVKRALSAGGSTKRKVTHKIQEASKTIARYLTHNAEVVIEAIKELESTNRRLTAENAGLQKRFDQLAQSMERFAQDAFGTKSNGGPKSKATRVKA
jgi:hypothetical protein